MRALNPFEYLIAQSPYSAPESQVDSNDSPDVNFWQFGPPWGASPCGGEDEEKSRPSGDNYPDTGGHQRSFWTASLGGKFHPGLGRDHQLVTPVEFLAMLVPHIALRYEVKIRTYGALSTTVRQ